MNNCIVFPMEVSIHAPVRGATNPIDSIRSDSSFQSTPLCEGRLFEAETPEEAREFQSTPLCEGRLFLLTRFFFLFPVSIHAPVRGATASFKDKGFREKVSIHAPVRGATEKSDTESPLS